MHAPKPTEQKILVAILNWNGWEDTIECCKSLAACKSKNIDILIFDNNSTNNSVESIRSFISKESTKEKTETHEISENTISIEHYNSKTANYLLCAHTENTGFAKGFNIASKYAKEQNYSHILILNNDTTVTENSLESMLTTIEQSGANLVVPQIRYFDNPDVIWNCGGEVTRWGKTKYYYTGEIGDNCRLPEQLKIEFATGCCMLVRTDYFVSIGGFTEKFFFGEEDVELSFRLKRLNAKLLCDTRAIIYHKVGSSIKGDFELLARKAFIHYLNRIINMRDQMPKSIWNFWRALTLARAALTFKTKYKRSIPDTVRFSFILSSESRRLKTVSKNYFQNTLKQGIGIERN